MLSWFYETNIWITLPLMAGGFVLVSCLIVLALRPVVRRLVTDANEWDRALAHVIGTFGVFFGILLALVAVSVYENFSDTRDVTIKAASPRPASGLRFCENELWRNRYITAVAARVHRRPQRRSRWNGAVRQRRNASAP